MTQKPIITFRDAEPRLPTPVTIPIGRTLEPHRDVLCKLLAELRPDVDPDLWTCATYSELMAFAIEALQRERTRIAQR
jgi:hypothetical protein